MTIFSNGISNYTFYGLGPQKTHPSGTGCVPWYLETILKEHMQLVL